MRSSNMIKILYLTVWRAMFIPCSRGAEGQDKEKKTAKSDLIHHSLTHPLQSCYADLHLQSVLAGNDKRREAPGRKRKVRHHISFETLFLCHAKGCCVDMPTFRSQRIAALQIY